MLSPQIMMAVCPPRSRVSLPVKAWLFKMQVPCGRQGRSCYNHLGCCMTGGPGGRCGEGRGGKVPDLIYADFIILSGRPRLQRPLPTPGWCLAMCGAETRHDEVVCREPLRPCRCVPCCRCRAEAGLPEQRMGGGYPQVHRQCSPVNV